MGTSPAKFLLFNVAPFVLNASGFHHDDESGRVFRIKNNLSIVYHLWQQATRVE